MVFLISLDPHDLATEDRATLCIMNSPATAFPGQPCVFFSIGNPDCADLDHILILVGNIPIIWLVSLTFVVIFISNMALGNLKCVDDCPVQSSIFSGISQPCLMTDSKKRWAKRLVTRERVLGPFFLPRGPNLGSDHFQMMS